MRICLDSIDKIEEFVGIVSHSKCDIDLISGKSTYLDAKSILGIMSCNIKEPLTIEIFGEESDKELVTKEISKFIIDED